MKTTTHFKQINNKPFVSKDVAAKVCGVTIITYNKWCKDENPPPYDVFNFMVPLPELGEWVRKQQTLKSGAGGTTPYMPDIDGVIDIPEIGEKERYDKLRADKIQMELDVRAKTLVKADDVTMAWSNILGMIKTRLTKIPTTIAPMVHGEKDVFEVQRKIEQAIHEALEELSNGE